MNKKKLLTLLLFGIMSLASVLATMPTELDCADFENETNTFCEDLDQIGTGISIMSYKLNLGLPAFLIGLAIVGVIITIVLAIVGIIKKSLSNVAGKKP